MKSADREELRRLAAEAILHNLKALAAQIPGVRARRGPEPVHDLRVAARRVRTALRLLDHAEPESARRPARGEDRYRRWDRQLKRLASALSRARDTDVQAEFLREFLQSHRDARLRPGIRQLLLRLRERREKQQIKVQKELDRFIARGTLREIRSAFPPLKGGQRRASGIRNSQFAIRNSKFPRPVLKRLKQMLAYEPYIARPDRREELHRMRIAAKHFRYTMEAFEPGSGGRLDPWIRAARRIQTELGEIHDCDVWIHETLPKFLADERSKAALAQIKPGVAALMRDRRKRRKAIHRAFLRRWKQLRRKKTFDSKAKVNR